MTKQSIKWHEDCLRNMSRYLNQKKDSLKTLQDKVYNDEARFCKYRNQIEEAKKQGKNGFDSEKFMKQKLKEMK